MENKMKYPYKCETCGKKFKTNGRFNNHLAKTGHIGISFELNRELAKVFG
jgi:predicted SprT family Zn-dependent metalloprotease